MTSRVPSARRMRRKTGLGRGAHTADNGAAKGASLARERRVVLRCSVRVMSLIKPRVLVGGDFGAALVSQLIGPGRGGLRSGRIYFLPSSLARCQGVGRKCGAGHAQAWRT